MARKSGKSITCPNCGCRVILPAAKSSGSTRKKQEATIPSSFVVGAIPFLILVILLLQEWLKTGG